MLRVYLALLGAGERWNNQLKKKGEKWTAADPLHDASVSLWVTSTAFGYWAERDDLSRMKSAIVWRATRLESGLERPKACFDDRKIGYEPVELTSRSEYG